MEIGVATFPTHDSLGPAQVARLAEEHGYESLFFTDHSHIPASRETPYAGGVPLPRKYVHTYDMFVALTAAAVVTTKVRIGRGCASSSSVTRSRPRRRSRASTTSPAAVSSSAWAPDGTARRWPTTAPTRAAA